MEQKVSINIGLPLCLIFVTVILFRSFSECVVLNGTVRHISLCYVKVKLVELEILRVTCAEKGSQSIGNTPTNLTENIGEKCL